VKILVVEYICGGGLCAEPLPSSLAKEGAVMLQTLLKELSRLPGLQISLTLDSRCTELCLPSGCDINIITPNNPLMQQLDDLICASDAVWPIAPESHGVLAEISARVEQAGKILLLSDQETVRLCSNKLATLIRLADSQIPVAATRMLHADNLFQPPCVIKPVDAEGCQDSFFLDNQDALNAILQNLPTDRDFIIQPYYAGKSLSLSALFRAGQAWLLSCNRQIIEIESGRFGLRGCQVNIGSERESCYKSLLQSIAIAMPGLWGYIGIDILESEHDGPLVLEINPRLTTSYAGIGAATGINVAKQIFALLDSEPDLRFSSNLVVDVIIHD
jgi:tyramine---L-glutamate ligase